MTDDAKAYRFRVGEFTCIALSDGSMDYPPGHIFANVPRAQIEADLQSEDLPVDYITMPSTQVLIQTGEELVLVDAGAGRMARNTGRLVRSLSQAEVVPADIGTVIITHAHPAHVGGLLDGAGEAVFPGANYFMWRGEWEFWTSEVAFRHASERHVAAARSSLGPIRDRLVLLDSETEVRPGISVIPAPGHTPGHMVVSVSAGGEGLMYIADTVFHPWHVVHPDWRSIYDILPEQADASKRRVLDLAAETGALVMAHHFAPFPSLGRVAMSGEGWEWQPVEAPAPPPEVTPATRPGRFRTHRS